jgi:hypothetical protein
LSSALSAHAAPAFAHLVGRGAAQDACQVMRAALGPFQVMDAHAHANLKDIMHASPFKPGEAADIELPRSVTVGTHST